MTVKLFVEVAATHAVIAQGAGAVGYFRVAGGEHASVAEGGQVFCGVEAEGCGVAERACGLATPFRRRRLARRLR